MKKIIFIMIAVLFSVTTFAQRGIPRTDNVSVSSTVVKKTSKQSETKYGFQQMINLEVALPLDTFAGISYTAGYKFNHWFLGGLGVGFLGNLERRVNQRLDSFYIPTYIHLRGYMSNKRWKPYASLSFGAFWGKGNGEIDLVNWNNKHNGVLVDGALGVECEINTTLRVDCALSCGNIANIFTPQLKVGFVF